MVAQYLLPSPPTCSSPSKWLSSSKQWTIYATHQPYSLCHPFKLRYPKQPPPSMREATSMLRTNQLTSGLLLPCKSSPSAFPIPIRTRHPYVHPPISTYTQSIRHLIHLTLTIPITPAVPKALTIHPSLTIHMPSMQHSPYTWLVITP